MYTYTVLYTVYGVYLFYTVYGVYCTLYSLWCIPTIYSLWCILTSYSLWCIPTIYSLWCILTLYSLWCRPTNSSDGGGWDQWTSKHHSGASFSMSMTGGTAETPAQSALIQLETFGRVRITEVVLIFLPFKHIQPIQIAWHANTCRNVTSVRQASLTCEKRGSCHAWLMYSLSAFCTKHLTQTGLQLHLSSSLWHLFHTFG